MERKLEEEIKRKSNNRCIVCHNMEAKCHLLDNRKDEDEQNLILLCDMCARKYLGNPDLIKQLKQRRDYWYKQVEEAMLGYKSEGIEDLKTDALSRRNMALYHVVYEYEGIKEAINDIFLLLKSAKEKAPEYQRILYLDIDGHIDEMVNLMKK